MTYEDEVVSFIDLEDEQPDTSIGEDTFGLEDDWGQWDTNAWTRDTQDVGEIRGGGSCMGDAGSPPESGTFVLGSIDGTCQWIDTTTCA